MTIDHNELTDMVDWENGLIDPRIFIDEDIYRLELEKVFGRNWLFLAHDSMIQKPGDFYSTYMGPDPVVVVRQRDGSVRAFLNVCRHRGMRVCRAEEGNAKVFMCPYHGWTYGTDGALVSIPHETDGYLNRLDLSKNGLVTVRVEEYKGFYFGNFDAAAPSLIDFLGDMAWYLDSWVDHADGGIEFLPGSIKWTINGNWKTAAEQFAGDAYHAGVSHASSQLNPDVDAEDVKGWQFSSPYGHGAGVSLEEGVVRLKDDPLTDYNVARLAGARQRFDDMRSEIGMHFTVFPNFSGLGGAGTLGVWHPKGPNKFEIWRYAVVEKNAPEEVKKLVQRHSSFTEGPAGTIEMDDGENWDMIGSLLQDGFQARRVKWNYQMGLGEPLGSNDGLRGDTTQRFFGEIPQRIFYRRWLELMTAGDEWPIPGPLPSLDAKK